MIPLQNGQAISLKELPLLSFDKFYATVVDEVRKGKRLASLFAIPRSDDFLLTALLADEEAKKLYLASSPIKGSFPSLTPSCPQAHLFEREIFEKHSLIPKGHPWLKPVRSLLSKEDEPLYPFYQIGGEAHEVAVGPVHARIIEPGHFRFQCSGEKIFHLEIALGFQHRGVERALLGGPDKRSLPYMETLSGDTTIGHSWAYCQALEALASAKAPSRAQHLRAIMLEIERLANHTGDLGALAGDIGFLPTASFCGRLRGDFLNMSALFCGSRFGRGMLRPGGVFFDCEQDLLEELSKKLDIALRETCQAVELLWSSSSVMNRFERCGPLTQEMAKDLGLVGVAARSCGIRRDVRTNFEFGPYKEIPVLSISRFSGDVLSRALVRYLEIKESASYIRQLISTLPKKEIYSPLEKLSPSSIAISLIEAWRGEICHICVTDAEGKFAYYKVTDPSFHNWIGLALACRQEEIYNFPLCNKSFSLSYCGHDL